MIPGRCLLSALSYFATGFWVTSNEPCPALVHGRNPEGLLLGFSGVLSRTLNHSSLQSRFPRAALHRPLSPGQTLCNIEEVLLKPEIMRSLIPRLLRAATLLTAAGLVTTLVIQPAQAQRVVPKIGNICPLGYVDTLNGKCTTFGLAIYTVQPTNGEACPSGWMNVGGRYCRKK